MNKRQSNSENIYVSKENGKIVYLIKKLNSFFNDENIHNVKLSSENVNIYSLRKLSVEDKEKYIDFLRLIWLTTVYQVQYLTSDELKGYLKQGIMYKHHITVYLERLKLIKKIANQDEKDLEYLSKFIDDIESIISKNTRKDLLLLTYKFFLESNSDQEVNDIFKKALKIPDFKTIDDEKFYLKNTEMISYVESVSKVFNIEENLKYLNKFSTFKINNELLENEKQQIANIKSKIINNLEKEEEPANPQILNKLMTEFKKTEFSNLSLEQMLVLEKASRGFSLNKFHSQLISKAISAIKAKSEDADDLFKSITDSMVESSGYKQNVSTLIEKIEDREKIKTFLTEYIKECIFNNVDNIDLNDFKGSIIENNQFVKIWTDCESQSLIEIDTKKLLHYVKEVAEKEIKLLRDSEDEIDVLEEEKLFQKVVKLNIDMENESAVEAIMGANYNDRIDGVNYGEFNSKDLIKNKMNVFVDYLSNVEVEASLVNGEENKVYIKLKHGLVKQQDVLDFIISAILTIEPNPLDDNYNLLLIDEFNKNVGYKLQTFKKINKEDESLENFKITKKMIEHEQEYYNSTRAKSLKLKF